MSQPDSSKYVPIWELQALLRQARTESKALKACLEVELTMEHISQAQFWLGEHYDDLRRDDNDIPDDINAEEGV